MAEFAEMALFARSIGDLDLETSLESVVDASRQFERTWTSAELRVKLPPRREHTLRSTMRGADTPRSAWGSAAHQRAVSQDRQLSFAHRLEKTGREGLEIGRLLLIVAAGLAGMAFIAAVAGSGALIPGVLIAIITLVVIFKNTGR